MGWGSNYMANTVKNLEEAKDFLKGRDEKRIAHETFVIDYKDSIGVRYHATNVVDFKKNGSITLKTNHWITKTTKTRINNLNTRYYMTDDSIVDEETSMVYPIYLFSNGLTLPYETLKFEREDVKNERFYNEKKCINGETVDGLEYSRWEFNNEIIYCGKIQRSEKVEVYWAFSGTDIFLCYDNYIYKIEPRIDGAKVCFNPEFVETKDGGLFIIVDTICKFGRISTKKCGYSLKEGTVEGFSNVEKDAISILTTTIKGENKFIQSNNYPRMKREDCSTFDYNGDTIKFKRKKVKIKKIQDFGNHIYIKTDKNKNYIYSVIRKKLMQIPDSTGLKVGNQNGFQDGYLTFTYDSFSSKKRIFDYSIFYYYNVDGTGIMDAVRPIDDSKIPTARILNHDSGRIELLDCKKQFTLNCYILNSVSYKGDLYFLTHENLKQVCYKVSDGKEMKIYPKDYIRTCENFEELVKEFSDKSIKEIMSNNIAAM